jgi:hypothetical protein
MLPGSRHFFPTCLWSARQFRANGSDRDRCVHPHFSGLIQAISKTRDAEWNLQSKALWKAENTEVIAQGCNSGDG